MTSNTQTKTVDAEVRDYVMAIDGAMDLIDVREAIEQIVVSHPDVGRVAVQSRGTKGAGVIRAYGPDDAQIATVTIRANGEIDALPVAAEDDRDGDVDEQTEKVLTAARTLGIDFDPSNCDVDALASDIEFVRANGRTFERAGIHPRWVGEMVTEQRQRVAEATSGKKDGLAKKALRDWIMLGDDGVKRLVEQARKTTKREKRALSTPGEPREGSTMWAALKVLRSARKPMTGQQVYEKIAAQSLAPGLKGKTPEATVTAALNVAVARGQHGITRPEPGKFALAAKS